MIEISVDAKVDNLYKVLDFIEKQLTYTNCGVKFKTQLSVAIEEIFVNIAKYAYDDGCGIVKIQFSFTTNPDVVTITFIDNGTEYNPLVKEDPDIGLSASDRPIGGLGIYITKKFVDDVTYDYKNNENILTIKKQI
jgi:anti-sigma regulatory factor (Ser/Thr protein kinase)